MTKLGMKGDDTKIEAFWDTGQIKVEKDNNIVILFLPITGP